MRIKSLLLSFILLFTLVCPVTHTGAAEFFVVSGDGNGILNIIGQTSGELVTVRSLFFGSEKPEFPFGIDNFEITAEQVNSGEINMNYFNIITAEEPGVYSAEIRLSEYGYYLITASSDADERTSRLYCYMQSGEILPSIEEMLSYSEKERVFEYGGERFVLLELKDSKATIIPYSDYGAADSESLDAFVENISLPSEMNDYAVNIKLPEYESVRDFADILGMVDGVGYYGNKIWRILSTEADNRDIEKYEPGELNEKASGMHMENLVFSDETAVGERNDTKETIVEFTAPVDGEYLINTGIYGTGNAKLQLTALSGEKIFDNNSLAIIDSGINTDNESSVELSAGDRIFLHIYPATGDLQLNYSISVGSEVYNLYDLVQEKNGWWMTSSENLYGCSMNSENLGSLIDAEADDELFVRPVISLDKSFFTECNINVDTAGGEVLSALRENFSRDDFTAYDSYEIDTIFNPIGGFEFEVLPFTDGEGQEITTLESGQVNANIKLINTMQNSRSMSFVMSVYSAEGQLLAMNSEDIKIAAETEGEYSVSVNTENLSADAYAKTFLWGSLEGMKPVSEIAARELTEVKLADGNVNNMGNWKFYVKPVNSTDHSEYVEQTVSGITNVNTGTTLPFVAWSSQNEDNVVSVRPEKTGDMVIEYTVPHKGNWKVEYTWKNVGLDVIGGDGGRLRLSYLPKGDNDDTRVIRNISVSVSSTNPAANSYSNIIAADGGDRILLSAYAGIDGYADRWEINYKITETAEQGKVIGEEYKLSLPVPSIDEPSKAEIKENTVWVGVDGNYADSDFMEKKILYFKKFIPNIGVIVMSGSPAEYHNSEFFEENGIPVIVQSYGDGYQNYIEENNAWEWDWNSSPLDSSHWQDMSGTAHAFSLPHYATKEVFSRIAKAAVKNGYSGFGFPDYVWMWGARGISGYNPETIEAFVDDLYERDGGLKCDDGLWFFHDYYRYYTGSDTVITPEDLGFEEWSEYRPLSQAENTALVNAGINTSSYWAVFDALCHYEWLKFAQYIADLAHDNGGICQIMPNPEYHPDGVDFLFLNKLVNVDMTEDEFFGHLDWLDGAYYRWDYLSKYDSTTNTGGVMEAGGGGNGGAYYTDELAYLSAFELGAMEYIDHLEVDFMYQQNYYSAERDGQLMSYGMGFSHAKELGLTKREADFTVVSSRNHLRPWSFDTAWKPWDLRLSFDGNADFNIAKMGYNFNGISQEGLLHGEIEETVVFSPHRVTESVWNIFLDKLKSGEIKTGIMSAGRFELAVTDKLSTVDFAEIAPGYAYGESTDIGLAGHILDAAQTTLTDTRLNVSGGIKTPLSGDETVLSYKTYTKTYPLVVKRDMGGGELYILLFDDALAENFALAEFVYDYILSQKEIKPMFKSLENSGTLTSDYTMDSLETAVANDIGVSARIYQSGELTAAGIQNSISRFRPSTGLTSTGICAPYLIEGTTSAKILMEPGKSYKYIAVPSMQEGTVTADEEGYAALSFEDTSYEIFFLLPEDSTGDFGDIKSMQNNWKNALKFE